MRVRVLSLAAAVAATMVLGVSPARAAPVLGVNVSGFPSDAQLAEASALGAKDVRMFLLWRDLEPKRKGELNSPLISAYAGAVRTLAAAGQRAVFVVTASPQWASGDANPNVPPRALGDYGDFLGRFAGSDGIKGNGIAYEVWNEEDAAEWWGPNPDAGAYVTLFKAAATALRGADPTAKVAVGPLTGNDYPFLEQLYAKGLGGTADAVSVHTDTACLVNGPAVTYRENNRLGRFSFLAYREVRATMVAHNDDKPVWVSEFGWSSTQSPNGGPACERGAVAGTRPSGVTENDQATFLTQAYHCMAQDPYVQVSYWFTARDATARETSLDELRHYGLLRGDGAHKPSWAAFRTIASSGDTLSGACGDFDGPSITIDTPKLGASYTGSLQITARATDPGGLGRLSFLADGKLIRNFGGDEAQNDKPATLDWQGAKQLSLGGHTIQVIALDKQGNQQQATVGVRKISADSLLAVGPATVKSGGVRCRKHRICTVRGRVRSPAGKVLSGKVQVRWQWLAKAKKGKKARFRTLHKRKRNANKPYVFTQKLRTGGQWRVTVRYYPKKKLKASGSPYEYFRVK